MTPHEFQDLVDRLGEDFQEWPKAVAKEARMLVRASDEAQVILGQAERLRRMLLDAGPQVSCVFADKVVATALSIDPPEQVDCGLLN